MHTPPFFKVDKKNSRYLNNIKVSIILINIEFDLYHQNEKKKNPNDKPES